MNQIALFSEGNKKLLNLKEASNWASKYVNCDIKIANY